jgi:hypothetical protein
MILIVTDRAPLLDPIANMSDRVALMGLAAPLPSPQRGFLHHVGERPLWTTTLTA